MVPKLGAGRAEYGVMTLRQAKRRATAQCKHDSLMRIEVAGMSREVCEGCGRVSLAYVEEHFHTKLAQLRSGAPLDLGDTSAATD